VTRDRLIYHLMAFLVFFLLLPPSDACEITHTFQSGLLSSLPFLNLLEATGYEQIPERVWDGQKLNRDCAQDISSFPTSSFGVRIGLAGVGDGEVSESLKKGSP
jgi:hypothetical protein